MKPLKIFYVIDAYDGPSGGTERQLLLLIRGMQAERHDVKLFVLRHTPYTLAVTDFPCPIECLGVHSLRSLRSFQHMRAFRRRLVSEKPDVLHAFFNDAAILVPLSCHGIEVRVFTSRRDMGYWYNRFKLALLRIANRRVDGVICNCKAVAGEVARRERVPSRKLLVIYNGLLPELLTPSGPALDPAGAAKDAQRSASEVRVCLVANLRPLKRIEDLIHAAAQVEKSLDFCRYLVIGETLDASYKRSLDQLAEELSVSGMMSFLDLVEDPIHLVQQCHIGVLSSESEGLSNAILEYMAAGLPVVCSNVGGNPELVEQGDNGFLYRAGDVDALASHLLLLCTDAAERTRMGAASLRRAKSFTPKAMVHAHLRAYQGGGIVNG